MVKVVLRVNMSARVWELGAASKLDACRLGVGQYL